MINLALFGASGKMGRAVIEEANKDPSIHISNYIVRNNSENLGIDVGEFHFSEALNEFFLAAPENEFDCIIDFATRDDVDKRIEFYSEIKKPLLFCTTGLSDQQIEKLKLLSNDLPIFIAPNTSILTALMRNLLGKIKKVKDNYEIKLTEKHHESKIDAPSGTAIDLASALNFDVAKIESIREGNEGNWHKALIFNGFEELELKHSAPKRSIYAQGALNIVKWFYQKPKNLYYMQTLIEDLYE